MQRSYLLLLALSAALLASVGLEVNGLDYTYETKYHEVALDHFSFVSNKTFQLRYLVNSNYSSDTGPILFYTGNEGDIELFAQNTGLIWELAPQLEALVVFAEHRFYGKSMPFGNDSYKSPEHLGYLTSEQALADFADLLEAINTRRPVIAFGGSYGGMLAAWFRMKYPHLVTGALASSAPVFQFGQLVPCEIFARILTSVFKTASDVHTTSNCTDNIKRSWPILKNYSSTADGQKLLTQKLKLCKPMNKTDDYQMLEDFLKDVYGNLAMVNYPYASQFLAPLPAYPVREFCSHLAVKYDGLELIDALESALSVYTNFTGKTKCVDINSAYDSSLGAAGWDFQACTEMVMPMCTTGTTDMFPAKPWSFKEYADECFKKFGVRAKENFAVTQYGGDKLKAASNIIFSNGLLDPWSGGGCLRSSNEKINIVIIPEGAHHLDLRASNEMDPASVVDARKMYTGFFKKWLQDFADQEGF